MRKVTLQDYKTTSVWSVIYGKPEWEEQLNFYAWLVEQNRPDTVVDKLQVVAILRDWKQRDAELKADYPDAPIMIVDVKLWSEAERDNYVRDRVRIHQQAEFERLTGGTLPECTDKERWVKATTYAVMKNKNKRAMKVFQDYESAQGHADQLGLHDEKNEYWVDRRPGEATRCEKYCAVNQWCDQWLREQETEDEEA